MVYASQAIQNLVTYTFFKETCCNKGKTLSNNYVTNSRVVKIVVSNYYQNSMTFIILTPRIKSVPLLIDLAQLVEKKFKKRLTSAS